jgi:hypothetical protein
MLFSSTKIRENKRRNGALDGGAKNILDLCYLLEPLELFFVMEGGGGAELEGRCCISKDCDGIRL